jgi:LuxR family transcriptional activator of rhlAB and lasB
MPCLCADWYRANAADFDEVSDAQQLAARLEALAVQHEFEQSLLILNFPTPFTRRRCGIIMYGSPMWVGSIDDEIFNPFRAYSLQGEFLKDPVAWAAEHYPAILKPVGNSARRAAVSGLTYSSIGGSGVRYSVSFLRSGIRVCEKERAELEVKFRCIVDMVRRTGERLGLGVADGFKLTSREIDVLRWTADGKCTHDVARILGISDNTVNYHVKKLMGKMGCCSKLQVVAYAARLQLI